MPTEPSLLEQVAALLDEAIDTTDPMERARLIEQASRLHRVATTIVEAKAGLYTGRHARPRIRPA
jgi:hypothetical protein